VYIIRFRVLSIIHYYCMSLPIFFYSTFHFTCNYWAYLILCLLHLVHLLRAGMTVISWAYFILSYLLIALSLFRFVLLSPSGVYICLCIILYDSKNLVVRMQHKQTGAETLCQNGLYFYVNSNGYSLPLVNRGQGKPGA
jgi:hypothetical protein